MKKFWSALERHSLVLLLVSIIMVLSFLCHGLLDYAARWTAIADLVEHPQTCPACGCTMYIVLEEGPSKSSPKVNGHPSAGG